MTKTILHGLSGPLDGRTYAEVMAPMGASSDRWIADVASFIRNGFGNSSSVVSEADVARVRKETTGRDKMWTAEELERTQPRPLVPDITWDATASHNTGGGRRRVRLRALVERGAAAARHVVQRRASRARSP